MTQFKISPQLQTPPPSIHIHNHSAACEELLSALPSQEPTHPHFTMEDIQQQLGRCKPGEEPARVLKLCTMQFSPILHSVFCESCRIASVFTIWKKSTLIRVPKEPCPSESIHRRPVALTLVAMRCLVKLVLCTILPAGRPQLDPYQFAYRETEDALECLLHSILQHLKSNDNFTSIVFTDFSTAFSTIQCHRMIKKLVHLYIPPFPSLRPQLPQQQTISCNSSTATSSNIINNSGAPQG